MIFFFPPVQQVRVKLIVDFHTDIDFKLGKLRVGGRGMFSDRGDWRLGWGRQMRRGQRLEDGGYHSCVLILQQTQNSFLRVWSPRVASSAQEISVTVWRSRSGDGQ